MKISSLPIFNTKTPHPVLLRRTLYAYIFNAVITPLGLFLYFLYFGYGVFLTSPILFFPFLYSLGAGIPLAFALLPGLIISILLHARNIVFQAAIYISLARIVFTILGAWWFSNNYNKGDVTQVAIQFFAVYIVLDILYHGYILARIPHLLFKCAAGIFLGCFAWSLQFVPWNDLLRLNWSTIQDMPLIMFVYYFCLLALYALLASVCLIATRRSHSS